MTVLIAITSHLLAVISPGPDTAIILKTTLSKGKYASRNVAYGIGTGIFFHCIFASIGLQIIERFLPNILQFITLAGGIYFIYIGISSLIPNPNENKLIGSNNDFMTGLLVNLLNTKALLFFISLFAYLKTQVSYIYLFVMYFPVATACWFLFLGSFVSSIGNKIKFLQSNAMNYMFALFFILTGIIILLTR